MASHGIIVSRLNAIPSRHKKSRLFNHPSRNGYQCASCSSVNPFLTVDHRLGKADGGTNDHKAKYYELLLLLS
jgi:5-methylcytosine-specific restriction endonuclease McrA